MLARYAEGAASLAVPITGSLVVVGNLDGVHRGHVRLVSDAVAEARVRGLLPVVLTFEPHPAEVIRGVSVQRLTTPERRFELLSRMEPSLAMVVEPFTLQLAALEPEAFVRTLLVDTLRAREVVVGKNFRFGHQRTGDLATLERLGRELGFRAREVMLAGDAHGAYSSSRVRALLGGGQLPALREILGRPHSVSGRVKPGKRLGRQLGFPTANLTEVPEALPPAGVYACLVEDISRSESGFRLGGAAVNVGVRPTVDGNSMSVEAHILDYSDELYGRKLRLHFEEWLRAEQKFTTLDELRAAIAGDVLRARSVLDASVRETLKPGPWY